MKRIRPWHILALMFALVAGALALAGTTDISSPGLNRPVASPVLSCEPVTRWIVQCNTAALDGAAATDIYAWSGWANAAREATNNAAAAASAGNTYTGGRLLVSREPAKRYEVLALIDSATGTSTIQVFQFDWVGIATLPGPAAASLIKPGYSAGIALGLPYNLARDSGGTTLTLTATAETAKVSYTTTGATLYVDEALGTTWYVCTRLIFDSSGGYAYLPYVVTLGGGATKLIILGRTI